VGSEPKRQIVVPTVGPGTCREPIYCAADVFERNLAQSQQLEAKLNGRRIRSCFDLLDDASECGRIEASQDAIRRCVTRNTPAKSLTPEQRGIDGRPA